MLILGLLFAVGLIALIAAFIISRGGDDRALAKAQKVSQPAQQQKPVAEAEAPKDAANAMQTQAEQSAQKPEAVEEDSPYVAIGGQLHEVTRQLRNLNEQSRELEQRLSHLSAIIDPLEPEKSEDEEITLVDLPAIPRNGLDMNRLTTARRR